MSLCTVVEPQQCHLKLWEQGYPYSFQGFVTNLACSLGGLCFTGCWSVMRAIHHWGKLELNISPLHGVHSLGQTGLSTAHFATLTSRIPFETT